MTPESKMLIDMLRGKLLIAEAELQLPKNQQLLEIRRLEKENVSLREQLAEFKSLKYVTSLVRQIEDAKKLIDPEDKHQDLDDAIRNYMQWAIAEHGNAKETDRLLGEYADIAEWVRVHPGSLVAGLQESLLENEHLREQLNHNAMARRAALAEAQKENDQLREQLVDVQQQAQKGWEATSRILKTQTQEFDTVGRQAHTIEQLRDQLAGLEAELKSEQDELAEHSECHARFESEVASLRDKLAIATDVLEHIATLPHLAVTRAEAKDALAKIGELK